MPINNRIAARVFVFSVLAAAATAQGFVWNSLTPPVSPSARTNHAMVYDGLSQTVVLFGGLAAGAESSDTWLWNSQTWSLESPGAIPLARSKCALAYDSTRQRVVLFGGLSGAANLSDTWQWDGNTWQQQSPANSPPARHHHAMAYDEARQRIVMFGGEHSTLGRLGDTWEWDGTSWLPVFAAPFPPARRGHAMAYDTARQRIVMFGGNGSGNLLLDDTWEWDGTNWQPRATANRPAARDRHALAYDSARQRVVLFGGDSVGLIGDTWEWDGNTWLQQIPTNSPPARSDHAAAFDALHQRVVVFGGNGTNGALDDTWINGTPTVLASATMYGIGCGVPALGFFPDAATPPLVGQTAYGTITDAPTPLAGVSLGFSNTFFGPFALPVTLSGIGMTGCSLLQSAEIMGFATSQVNATTLSFGLAIPNQSAVLGNHLYVQAYCLAPGANALQVIASNGIDWFVGDTAPAGPMTSIVESFLDSSNQDQSASGGTWGGSQGPGARVGLVGGDGRHGSFDPTLGTALGNNQYVWNTDNFVIPASSTTSGVQETVTDGRFFFSDMIIPNGTRIRFVGSVSPVLYVRGRAQINGIIEVNGVDAPGILQTTGAAVGEVTTTFDALSSLVGQPGSLGGVGGGQGGTGGNRCMNTGPTISGGINVTDGQPGADVRVSAGHAYMGSATGTGGVGGLLTPTTGMWPPINVPTVGGILYCAYFSPGGSGGGFHSPGGTPDVPVYTGTSTGVAVSTAPVAGGLMFGLMPYPPVGAPSTYTSLEHFTIGGSGGGGGGSHGYGIIVVTNPAVKFMAGHGGTGGGGAVAIRSGGPLVIGPTALLTARGGDGVVINGTASTGNSSPGGGGSGGSFLMQSGQSVSIAGTVDARGGVGSRNDFVLNVLQRVEAAAGDGAPGFFRMEAPSSNVAFGGTSTPAYVATTMGGNLTDRDDRTGDRSQWYANVAPLPPVWDRYELDVDLDGNGTVDVTYDDSGAPGTILASEPNGPITLPLIIKFQGSQLDPITGEPIAGTVGPWRPGIGSGAGTGVYLDSATSVRFDMTFNRALFPDLVVVELRILTH